MDSGAPNLLRACTEEKSREDREGPKHGCGLHWSAASARPHKELWNMNYSTGLILPGCKVVGLCAQDVGYRVTTPSPAPSEYMNSRTRWLSPVSWRRAQLWAFSSRCHSSWQTERSRQGTYSCLPRVFRGESHCTFCDCRLVQLFPHHQFCCSGKILDCLGLGSFKVHSSLQPA